MALEYRVTWSASSNVTFQDEGEWHEANEDETAEEIEDALGKGDAICDGLEMALSESGFEWSIETREKGIGDA
jgi:hypothetical protein